MRPTQWDFNWGNLWADLLKGVGTGLLEYDGSRAAQAALAGLKVFDAAQDRRRRDRPDAEDGVQGVLPSVLLSLSPEELASYLKLPEDQRRAYAVELAETQDNDALRIDRSSQPNGGVQPNPGALAPRQRGRPISVNPLDGWHLSSVLPFGSSGSHFPTYRR